MQGAQPSPNSTPSSGAAASPTAGTWWIRQSRCIHGTTPEEDQPEHDRQDPEHDGDLALVGEQPLPHGPDQRAVGDEHEREAEHEQQRAGEHPAAAGVGEVGAGEPGGVGEVAGQQRHHARREEGDQARDHRHRDGEQQRAAVGLAWRTSRRGPAAITRPAPFSTSRTRSTSVCLRWAPHRGCWRRRGPACRGRPCSGSRWGSGCRGRRAGVRPDGSKSES